MNNIQVNLLDPTRYGRLYYQNNPEIEPVVLFLQNGLRIKRTSSINIDSAIILDLNENQIIQAAEFIIHKKVWKIDSTLAPPHPEMEADIQVINLVNRNELLEAPVHSITDQEHHCVFFHWGTEDIDKKWIYLSKNCCALVSGKFLIGFFIYLSPDNGNR